MADWVVIFGNCQVESLATAFQHVPELQDKKFLYIPSFNITEDDVEKLITPEIINDCSLLFEQVTPKVNLTDRYTLPNARRVTFPSLDINLFWPLRAVEKRIQPEPPKYPFGRYTYGDRVINEILDKGLEGDEAWDYYQTRSAVLLPDMNRLASTEERRWAASERTLDVKMSDLIFPSIRAKRLFWTYNHPTREVLCQFGGRILKAANLAPDDDQKSADLMWGLLTWEFGADYQAPIHPLVAQQLELSWWSPDMTYRKFDVELTYEAFIRGQIAWS